jgi:hypothetical protein
VREDTSFAVSQSKLNITYRMVPLEKLASHVFVYVRVVITLT